MKYMARIDATNISFGLGLVLHRPEHPRQRLTAEDLVKSTIRAVYCRMQSFALLLASGELVGSSAAHLVIMQKRNLGAADSDSRAALVNCLPCLPRPQVLRRFLIAPRNAGQERPW
jgi:hypothetical protein